MNIKKLIAIVAFTLGAWMSVGVAQATNYDFTFTDSSNNFYNVSLSNSDAGYIDRTQVTGLFAWCANCGNSEVLTITSTTGNPFYLPDLGLGGSGVVDSSHFPFNVSFTALDAQGNPISTYVVSNTAVVNVSSLPSAYQSVNVGVLASSFNIYPTSNQLNSDCICLNFGTSQYPIAPGNAAVGAPEIDGSLTPKVGLLLGCLFFLMGRKKEVVEPMLTA